MNSQIKRKSHNRSNFAMSIERCDFLFHTATWIKRGGQGDETTFLRKKDTRLGHEQLVRF